ncbi:hypothetical protein AACH06_00220 [Ideonella sp. DXS29W]|uniref:WG repeat-containing protein n=1 Tax=Ideonella lacteola TaxID=2984193 RepID=A0ABU9BH01_9BURK
MQTKTWRARAAAATLLTAHLSVALATTFEVKEMPVIEPPTTDPYHRPREIDASGRILVNVQDRRHQQVFFLSERCRPERCRRITPRGYSTSWASMNAAGQMAGEVWIDGTSWAARHDPSAGEAYLTQGAARGINASGVVVGNTLDLHPFVYGTRLQWIPMPGDRQGIAAAINDQGVVVGHFFDADAHQRAFVNRDGTTKELLPDAPRYTDSTATDINGAGIAVGCAQASPGQAQMAVRFEAGAVVTLGELVSGTRSGTCAQAVNESGRLVVGYSGVDPLDATKLHGFVHDGTTMRDLNQLLRAEDAGRYTIYSAVDVNNAGQIAAQAIRVSDGAWVAVRLEPIP